MPETRESCVAASGKGDPLSPSHPNSDRQPVRVKRVRRIPPHLERNMTADGEGRAKDSAAGSLRINWQVKALLPIAFVLLNGLLLFMLASLSWRDPERHTVLVVAGAGAVAIC